MDDGVGGRGEVGEEIGDTREWGAGSEERVSRADFGGPVVVGDWYLGPVEEVEHALSASALLLCFDAPW